jgi:FxsC-like protein
LSEEYVYFLSYARTDRVKGPSGEIDRFHKDLSAIISQRLPGVDEETCGFLDTADIEPGADWSETLAHALRTARVFIPILSPTYFDRPYCGKEWAAFSQRLSSNADNLIQPVRLVARIDLDPQPPVVAVVQSTHDSYPAAYNKNGLAYLLSASSTGDEYRKFLHAFADVVVSAMRKHPLEPAHELAPLREIQSAFHNPATQEQDVVPDSSPGRRLFAQFIYVAARNDEIASLRADVSGYGDEGGLDWQPYFPDTDTEIGMIAAEVASRERFRYEPIPLNEGLVDTIAAAVRRHKIVVVIVDPWTVRLSRYQRLMKELDERSLPTCVVLIPLNERDPEAVSSREKLQAVVEATFVNRMLAPDPDAFVPWIPTFPDLSAQLATKLTRAKLRVLQSHNIARRIQGESLIVSLPQIDASPRGNSS